MVLKKPVSNKTSSWNKVAYQRHSQGGGCLRVDQTKWRRTIQELIKASDTGIIKILKQDKFLPEWSGAVCPKCEAGVLGTLQQHAGRNGLWHRCNKKNCQQYVSPIHFHPIFTATPGPEGHSLQMQSAALLLRLCSVPLSVIHLVTHINHKAIEKMSRSLALIRKSHVLKVEKPITFGGAPRAWRDVEVDEATFDKKTLEPWEVSDADQNAGKNTLWEQWGGLVQRGCPKTLVLVKLNPAVTVPRAPGPGAMRKIDWKPLAHKYLKNRRVILHSDSARSYRMKVPGMLHDAVIHQKKRVKRAGKWVWKKPTFVKVSSHKLPDGRTIKTKAGTQIIDRAWRFIKERLRRNQRAKAGSSLLALQIRSAQWEYWHRNEDLWACTGALLREYTAGFAKRPAL